MAETPQSDTETDQPQIYLITPPEPDLVTFPDQLARVLDGADIACLRLSLATREEDRLIRAADALRDVAHRYDVAMVIDTHVVLADRLGLDGVHLTGARGVRAARKDLGADAIVGAFCDVSRHDGISAGESGADYIAFGPVTGTALGDGSLAGADLFEWWTHMIEVPVVAEGALTPDMVRTLAPITDFFGIGEEIWSNDDPLAALNTLLDAMK